MPLLEEEEVVRGCRTTWQVTLDSEGVAAVTRTAQPPLKERVNTGDDHNFFHSLILVETPQPLPGARRPGHVRRVG